MSSCRLRSFCPWNTAPNRISNGKFVQEFFLYVPIKLNSPDCVSCSVDSRHIRWDLASSLSTKCRDRLVWLYDSDKSLAAVGNHWTICHPSPNVEVESMTLGMWYRLWIPVAMFVLDPQIRFRVNTNWIVDFVLQSMILDLCVRIGHQMPLPDSMMKYQMKGIAFRLCWSESEREVYN